MREKISAEVYDLLKDILDDDDIEITDDSDIVKDLELSSLELAGLLASLEKKYRVKITDDAMRQMTTVGGIIEYSLPFLER